VNAARSTARRVINSTLAVARPGSVEWDSRRRARVRRPGWGRPAGTTRKPEEDSMVRTVDLKDPHRPETAVGHGGHGRPRGRESAGPRLAALHGDLNRSRRRPSTGSGTAWRPCSTTWRSCRPEAGSLPATGWIRPTTATTTSPPAAGSSSAGSPRGRASRNSSSSPRPRSPRPGDAGRSPSGRDQGEQHRRADPVEAMMRPPQVDLGPDLSAL
jgi:hypothetical protein